MTSSVWVSSENTFGSLWFLHAAKVLLCLVAQCDRHGSLWLWVFWFRLQRLTRTRAHQRHQRPLLRHCVRVEHVRCSTTRIWGRCVSCESGSKTACRSATPWWPSSPRRSGTASTPSTTSAASPPPSLPWLADSAERACDLASSTATDTTGSTTSSLTWALYSRSTTWA